MDQSFENHSLQELGLLDSVDAGTFDNLTDLAATVLKAPVSLVSIIDQDRDRQYFKSIHGTLTEPFHRDRETPLSHSFCQHVAHKNAPLMVADSRQDARLIGNGAITDLNVISYLGVPVHNPQNQAIGALCVIDGKPRQWTEGDVQVLEALAKCVDDAIKLTSSRRTTEQERDQKRVAQLVIQELSHRLNNLFSSIQSLISLSQFKYTDVGKYAEDLRTRIFAISHANKVSIRDGRTDTFYLDQLIEDILEQYEDTGYRLSHKRSGLQLDAKLATPLGLIINELATNALKHGAWSCHGEIDVQLDQQDVSSDEARLTFIWNEHCPDNQSHPPSDIGTGFGTKLIKMSIQQLGAEGNPQWEADGLTYEIDIPIKKVA